MGIKIIGTGKKMPDLKIFNSDLEKFLDTNNEWILTRTGIKNRYISTNETTSSLAIDACNDMFKNIKFNPLEIGLIICATMTPDTIIPTVAAKVKKSLNIPNCPAFDINVACSGFIYALSVAESMMKNLNIKKSIVIGVDLNSQIVNWTDRATSVVFGDGAGCVLLSSENEDGILSTVLNTTDDLDNSLTLSNTLYETPFKKLSKTNNTFKLKMNGQSVMKFAINAIKDSIEKVIKAANLNLTDIKLIIPHQANQRIINGAAKSMKIEADKFFCNIHEYGNTSAASLPIALDEAVKNKNLQNKDYIILIAFGGGLSSGAILLKW